MMLESCLTESEISDYHEDEDEDEFDDVLLTEDIMNAEEFISDNDY